MKFKVFPLVLILGACSAYSNDMCPPDTNGNYCLFTGAFQSPPLKSSEGSNILLSGQNYSTGESDETEVDTARQIKIVVNGTNLRQGSKVRVVLQTFCTTRSMISENVSPSPQNNSYEVLDLQPETDGSSLDYFGAFTQDVVFNSAVRNNQQTTCNPQLSVVVDGNWQTDPVNGTHNFNVNGL